MDRLRIYGWAATGLVLATLGFLSAAPVASAKVAADMASRSAGLALLGSALVAAGLVFRAAMRAGEKPPRAATPLTASEYRRGFGRPLIGAKRQSPRAIVVALRRAVAQGIPAPAATSATLPRAEIGRLTDLLRKRTAGAVARERDTTGRRLERSDVDQHSLSPR